MIRLRRVFHERQPEEQYSVFVDRLWPRGLPKQNATWNERMPEIAPSPELRKWFHKDTNRWDEFKLQYARELSFKVNELKKLKTLEKQYGELTLCYAAKDQKHNHAIVIKEMLEKM